MERFAISEFYKFLRPLERPFDVDRLSAVYNGYNFAVPVAVLKQRENAGPEAIHVQNY
jgi:hypothetical protein